MAVTIEYTGVNGAETSTKFERLFIPDNFKERAQAKADRLVKTIRAKLDRAAKDMFTAQQDKLFHFHVGVAVLGSNKILVQVDASPYKLTSKELGLRPKHDTAGQRVPVFVTVFKDAGIKIPNGFIWKGRPYRRVGNTQWKGIKADSTRSAITLAEKYVRTGASNVLASVAKLLKQDFQNQWVAYVCKECGATGFKAPRIMAKDYANCINSAKTSNKLILFETF